MPFDFDTSFAAVIYLLHYRRFATGVQHAHSCRTGPWELKLSPLSMPSALAGSAPMKRCRSLAGTESNTRRLINRGGLRRWWACTVIWTQFMPRLGIRTATRYARGITPFVPGRTWSFRRSSPKTATIPYISTASIRWRDTSFGLDLAAE